MRTRHSTAVLDDDVAPAGQPDQAAPLGWRRLAGRYPGLAAAYDALREACSRAGPLDERTLALVKLSVSVGAGASRTVHAHAKKALRAGVDPDELRHVAFVALPTIGLPAAMDALKWIEDSVQEACKP